jgi:transcriptional regulator with XRE-family HTH domain
MDLAALTTNLRRWRITRGKSQGELATDAGLSRVGYRNIETGAVTPRIDTLMRVAEALGAPLTDLLAPARSLQHVRFRTQRKMTSREEILATLARELDALRALEALVPEERRPFVFGALGKKLARKRPGAARAEAAAAEARKAAGIAPDEPIRDMAAFLETGGVTLLVLVAASEGFYGLSANDEAGGPAIAVNAWERIPVERRIFAAAEELGHLVLHPASYDVRRSDERDAEAAEARHFAAALLVPHEALARAAEVSSGLSLAFRVMKLKRLFGASWQTLLGRLTAGAPRPKRARVYRAFLDEWSRRTGKRIGPDEPPPGFFRAEPIERASDEPLRLEDIDFLPSRRARLARLAVERGALSPEKAAEMLGVSADEAREIVEAPA